MLHFANGDDDDDEYDDGDHDDHGDDEDDDELGLFLHDSYLPSSVTWRRESIRC